MGEVAFSEIPLFPLTTKDPKQFGQIKQTISKSLQWDEVNLLTLYMWD